MTICNIEISFSYIYIHLSFCFSFYQFSFVMHLCVVYLCSPVVVLTWHILLVTFVSLSFHAHIFSNSLVLCFHLFSCFLYFTKAIKNLSFFVLLFSHLHIRFSWIFHLVFHSSLLDSEPIAFIFTYKNSRNNFQITIYSHTPTRDILKETHYFCWERTKIKTSE